MKGFLTDFHIHSTFSDGKHSIPEIIDFYGKREFGAIAITDHLCEANTLIGKAAGYLNRTLTPATYPLYLEILRSETERAWDQYKMLVIPGFELTKNSVSNHRSAHILAIGVEEFLRADADPAELARKIIGQGGIAVAAHPVSTRKMEKQTFHLWDRREELASLFTAWEVAAGIHLFDEVLKSGLPMLANSDMHSFKQMTSWKTLLHCERSREAVLDAIRKQDVQFVFYNAAVHGVRDEKWQRLLPSY